MCAVHIFSLRATAQQTYTKQHAKATRQYNTQVQIHTHTQRNMSDATHTHTHVCWFIFSTSNQMKINSVFPMLCLRPPFLMHHADESDVQFLLLVHPVYIHTHNTHNTHKQKKHKKEYGYKKRKKKPLLDHPICTFYLSPHFVVSQLVILHCLSVPIYMHVLYGFIFHHVSSSTSDPD